MIIRSTKSESVGLLFEGDRGRIFVNRGRVSGKPVEQLADDPLPEDAIVKVYGGRQPGNHMRNFIESVRDRVQPISDVFSHHRAVTTCHLANISLRLGRKLEWDPVAEQIVGDEEANSWLSRTPRAGYEIDRTPRIPRKEYFMHFTKALCAATFCPTILFGGMAVSHARADDEPLECPLDENNSFLGKRPDCRLHLARRGLGRNRERWDDLFVGADAPLGTF